MAQQIPDKKSPYELRYRLSKEEAQTILRKGHYEMYDLSLFERTPYDTLWPNELHFPEELGYYLKVGSSEHSLLVELQLVQKHDLLPINGPGIFEFVVEKDGQLQKDAKVRWNNRSIRFNEKSQSYQMKSPRRRGIVSIEDAEFTSLYLMSAGSPRYWQSGFEKVGGRIIHFLPIELVWKPWYDGVKSIVQNYPAGYVQKIASVFNGDGKWRRLRRRNRGYLVLNKPMFRPGDTIRYKGKLANHQGRPVRSELELQFQTYYPARKTVNIPIEPKNGAFSGEFILHDSLDLKIDRYYALRVMRKGNEVLERQFKLEDYELKSEFYSTSLAHKRHDPLQENKVILKGLDENENPLRNIRYELEVSPTRLIAYWVKPGQSIPGILYTKKGKLNEARDTEVVLPDSIFRGLNMDYQVKVGFINAANNRTEEQKTAQYRLRAQAITSSLEKDSIVVRHLPNYQGETSLQIWAPLTAHHDTLLAEGPTPLKVKLNPAFSHYDVHSASGEFIQWLDTDEWSDGILEQYSRTADALEVSLTNPLNLPIWYVLYKNKRQVQKGFTMDSLNLERKSGPSGTYQLQYRYLWLGEVREQQIDLYYFKKQLRLEVDQSQLVVPGSRDSIRIRVTDQKGVPQANVDLTAMAFTGKFKSFTIPELPYFGNSRDYNFRSLYYSKKESESGGTWFNYDQWNDPLDLNSKYYYRVTNTEELLTSYTAAPGDITQFAVLPLSGSYPSPIGYIKLDGKLVFVNLNNSFQAWVFKAEPGWHQLELRTDRALIKLDSVYFEEGKKTLVSVPVNRTGKGLTIIALGDKKNPKLPYTQDEIKLLKQHSLHIQVHNNIVFKAIQNDRTYYAKDGYQGAEISPLLPGKVRLEFSDRQSVAFDFEPGFVYELIGDRVYKKEVGYKSFRVGRTSLERVFSYLPDPNAKKPAPLLKITDLNVRSLEQTKSGLLASYPAPERELTFDRFLIRGLSTRSLRELYVQSTAWLDPGLYEIMAETENGFYIDSLRINMGEALLYPIDPPEVLQRKPARYDSLMRIMYPVDTTTLSVETITIPEPKVIGGKEVFGRVTGGDDGLGIPRANVTIKGTSLGTPTSIDGEYSLFLPNGGATLVFSFLGYVTQEIYVTEGQKVNVMLQPDMQDLAEVVVVGYGSQEKRGFATVADVPQTLQSRVAGISIASPGSGATAIKLRGLSSFGENEPLIVVDGVPVASMEGILPGDIDNIATLKNQSATAIYGNRAAGGVILVTTKKGKRSQQVNNPFNVPLDNSEFSLRNNFRDYAYWQPTLTTDANGEASFVAHYPDDVTSWKGHFLAMSNNGFTGKLSSTVKAYKPAVARLMLPRFAVQGDSTTAYGQLANYTPDSLSVSRHFQLGDIPTELGEMAMNTGHLDSLGIEVESLDSIKVTYQFKSNAFTDGEQRKIPVYPRGIIRAKGAFHVLEGDSTLLLNADPELGTATIAVMANLKELMLQSLKALQDYRYTCNEQTASKIIALVAQKSAGGVTQKKPERKQVQQLTKTQNEDGSWGWWPGMRGSNWVTNHATRALWYASHEGHELDKALKKATKNLKRELPLLYQRQLLLSLETLTMLDSSFSAPEYIALNEKQFQGKMTVTDRLRFARIKQMSGQPVAVDSLINRLQASLFGGSFLVDSVNNLHSNDIEATRLTYELIKTAGYGESTLSALREYLLLSSPQSGSLNTYQVAKVMLSLAGDLSGESRSTLTLNGKLITQFPFRQEFPQVQNMLLKKEGDGKAYVSLAQHYREEAPEVNEALASIRTYFMKEGDATDSTLQKGELYTLKVELDVKERASFVMIEVPIPAGSNYTNKPRAFRFGEHREYYKDRVIFYFENLNKGTKTLSIPLNAQFPGRYQMNPVRLSLMYSPLIDANNGSRTVRIQ